MEGHPRQIVLSELKIHSLYLEDALAAILHTILFVRAPSIIKAKDQACQNLAPLLFATCGTKEIDQSIESSIQMLKSSLFPTEAGMRGELLLSFFDKQEVKEFMGWVTRSQNICFEVWRVSVVLLDSGFGDGIAASLNPVSSQERAAQYKTAYDQVTTSVTKVIEAVNAASDHVPLSMYDYEISLGGRITTSRNKQEDDNSNATVGGNADAGGNYR
mmetsp:Transcript_63864/g.125748  ORF Transcript_63864/g.125748 Transcript_63864/m.125748 type:complete len:216 (-) Transcript_63864:77-724(-)